MEINRIWVAVSGLAVVVAIVNPALAQRGGGRGFGRLFGGVPRAQLATLDDVQAELKLTDEQKTEIADINDQLREDRRNLFGGGFGQFSEIRSQMEKLNREASDEVDQKLDAAQKQRLLGIAVQVNGPAALNDPSIVDQLGLSEEQQQKLNDVRAENSNSVEETMSNFGELSRDERREKFRYLADTANEKLLGVLNEEQKTKFDAMKGQEIEIDPSSLFGRGRGGNR